MTHTHRPGVTSTILGAVRQLLRALGRHLLGLAQAQPLTSLAQLGFQLQNPLAVVGHGQAMAVLFELKFQVLDLTAHLTSIGPSPDRAV